MNRNLEPRLLSFLLRSHVASHKDQRPGRIGMFLHIRYMLDGLSATMAERCLSWCIFRPRGSQGWRADGEIVRRDRVLQSRKFTKRSFIESHAIRVENHSLFGKAVIMNPQQAEVMLSRGRHDYGLWPKLFGRMSSIQTKLGSGHLIQVVSKDRVDSISSLKNDDRGVFG
jgi:hypothetical protein